MPKVIVFDVDGTLIDSIPSIWKLYLKVSEEVSLPKRSYDEFRCHLGKTWKDVLEGLWPGIDVDEFSRHYPTDLEESKPIEGVLDAVSKLSEDHRVAVLTSRGEKTLGMHMDAAGFDMGVFEQVFNFNNTVHHKPDPRVFLEVAEKIGVKVEDILYIGDSIIDYECCAGAGVYFIGVLTGASTREEFVGFGVDCLDSVANLPAYVLENSL